MKFVTVMDMWLLIMNGILLGAILYYGRKLISLVARATTKQDENTATDERKRIVKMIENELNMFKQAHTMGDDSAKAVVDEIELILNLIREKKQ
jgi:hypothetical protein